MATRKVFGILSKSKVFNIHRHATHHIKIAAAPRCYCVQAPSNGGKSNMEDLFLKPDVQDILKSLTGMNIDKVFRARPSDKFKEPDYELMTDEQLRQNIKAAEDMAEERLQMVPVLNNWDAEESEVLSADAEIEGFSNDSYVFVDISPSIKRSERMIVIREPDGNLRTAPPAEKNDYLNNMFPVENRMFKMPEMFKDSNLESVLLEGRYEYILDRASVQFEPDNPEFNRVTQRTYEHLDSTGSYDSIWSTRHYGTFLFHLTHRGAIDGLLIHLITSNKFTDAGSLVKLFYLVHYEKKVLDTLTPHQLIKGFLAKDCRKDNMGRLELALQSYGYEDKQQMQQ